MIRGRTLVNLSLLAGGLCSVALLAASAIHWPTHQGPVSIWETGASHQRWEEGQCAHCHGHSAGGTVEVTGVPRFHEEAFRRFTHGRESDIEPRRCFACHSEERCQECHDMAPPSHTSGFRAPEGSSDDALRHVMLGRLRPSSCLRCHGSFVQDCSRCHGLDRLREWQARAQPALRRWEDPS